PRREGGMSQRPAETATPVLGDLPLIISFRANDGNLEVDNRAAPSSGRSKRGNSHNLGESHKALSIFLFLRLSRAGETRAQGPGAGGPRPRARGRPPRRLGARARRGSAARRRALPGGADRNGKLGHLSQPIPCNRGASTCLLSVA